MEHTLQLHLLQAGVLWHLLLFFFNYDYTLEEGGVEKSEESNQQEVWNRLANLSLTACSRLGGYLSGSDSTPENDVIQLSLRAMLTPYITHQLGKNHPTEVSNRELQT